MSYEFIERADELQPQAGSSRSGGPPRKSTLAGVLNPQNCPQCGQRFPSKIEESAMRKTRAKDADEWEKLREKISYKVCTCLEPTSNSRELTHRFACRYECPAPKNWSALGSPATSSFARSVSFKVVGSYR